MAVGLSLFGFDLCGGPDLHGRLRLIADARPNVGNHVGGNGGVRIPPSMDVGAAAVDLAAAASRLSVRAAAAGAEFAEESSRLADMSYRHRKSAGILRRVNDVHSSRIHLAHAGMMIADATVALLGAMRQADIALVATVRRIAYESLQSGDPHAYCQSANAVLAAVAGDSCAGHALTVYRAHEGGVEAARDLYAPYAAGIVGAAAHGVRPSQPALDAAVDALAAMEASAVIRECVGAYAHSKKPYHVSVRSKASAARYLLGDLFAHDCAADSGDGGGADDPDARYIAYGRDYAHTVRGEWHAEAMRKFKDLGASAAAEYRRARAARDEARLAAGLPIGYEELGD